MHISRWLFFFLIALGLGYPAVMRYSPPSTGGLSDTAFYYSMTEDGFQKREQNHWKYRLLIPALAGPIRTLLFTVTGRPESTAAAMLVVTAALVATAASVVGMLALATGMTPATSTVASLIWLSSFPVANYQLAGMVDSAESLAVAVMLLAGILGRWPLVLAIPVLTFGKETALPLSLCAAVGFILYHHRQRRPYLHVVAWTATVAVLGILSVVTTRWVVYDDWAGLLTLIDQEHMRGDLLADIWQILVNRGNLYIFLGLLPTGLAGRQYVPASLWLAAGLSAVGALALATWNEAGPNAARPLFSALGPVLSIGAAAWLTKRAEPHP